MMNINVFYSYTLPERVKIVRYHGEFISKVRYLEFYLSLYTVDGQFIEVYYNIRNQSVEEVEILDFKDERLNLYAVAVNLSDLYRKSL